MIHQRLEFPAPGSRPRRTMPAALRDPKRAATLVGPILMIVGSLQPWILAWKPGTGWFEMTGFQQSGDGGIVLELAVVAIVLAWSNRAWLSRTALIIGAPALLGVACLALMRLYYNTSGILFQQLRNAGGHGSFEFGFWLTIVGASLTVVTGGVSVWRARGRLVINSDSTGHLLTGAVGTIGGIAGGIGGFIVGSRITGLLIQGSSVGATLVTVALIVGLAIAGGWLGAVGAAGTVRAIRKP